LPVLINIIQSKNFKIIINNIDIEKKPNMKYPKYLKSLGNFLKSTLARLVTFPSTLLKWPIASLNGFLSSFIQVPPFTSVN
jgi:hypothetical protein